MEIKRGGEYRGILKTGYLCVPSASGLLKVYQKMMTVLRYQRIIRVPYLNLKLNLLYRSEDSKSISFASSRGAGDVHKKTCLCRDATEMYRVQDQILME